VTDPTIEVLDADETATALANRQGKTESVLGKIADSLMGIVGTDESVYATGLTEGLINSLRTRMYRRDIAISVAKVNRGGAKGHVIKARKVEEGPDGR
jgi:hypothetical protein